MASTPTLKDVTTTTTTTPAPNTGTPLERRYDRGPKISHTTFLRELTMPDGRKAFIDKRAVAFILEAKPGDFDGKKVSIVAFRTIAKPIPVIEGYHDLKSWWRGDGANGKAA